VNYFRTIPIRRTTPRIVLTDETKFGANNLVDNHLSRPITGRDPHFICEIFFLNGYAHWIGLGPAIRHHSQLKGYMTEMQCELSNVIKTTRSSQNEGDPVMETAERIRGQIQEVSAHEAAMDCVMSCDQQLNLDFLGFVANWLLRLADRRHEHADTVITLPLNKDIPTEWLSLPQFLMEIISDHLVYMMK
jgi:hypothetical protein